MINYIAKGARVRARWFEAKPIGSYSIAGAQMKLVGSFVEVIGEVRHIRGDAPTDPKKVELWIKPDDDSGDLCEKCNVKEIGPINQRHIVEVL